MQTDSASGAAMVALLTEDGQRLLIDRPCAQQIGILRAMLVLSPVGEETATFPLPSVKSTIMSKVIEYLEQHKSDPDADVRNDSPPLVSRLSMSKMVSGADADAGGDGNDDEDDEDANCSVTNRDGRDQRRPAGLLGGPVEESCPSPSEEDESDGEEYIYEDYLAKVTPWDQKYADSLDLPTLIEITKAANYLNIPGLLDLCCRTIAKQMTGLKAEELRKKFNLSNDFTPEEEAKMAAEFAWIED